MTDSFRCCAHESSPISLSLPKTFSTTPCLSARAKEKAKHQRGLQNSYAFQHAKQRREANISRQAILKQQRDKARGDPIRGITTPFVESFDTLLPPADSDGNVEADDPLRPPPIPAYIKEEKYRKHLNNFITKDLLEKSLEFSSQLTKPVFLSTDAMRSIQKEAEEMKLHQDRHENATKAINAIVSLQNCSSKDRTRINMQRIIDTFGRHTTDLYLRPKAPAPISKNASKPRPEPTPRAGPDVGSSEVQIGILTAKIRVLADRYEGRGSEPNRKDKANKRNLRLLLHRRQKLLKYMVRKERGSERWHNLVQTLGLTEATWKGQIEVR